MAEIGSWPIAQPSGVGRAPQPSHAAHEPTSTHTHTQKGPAPKMSTLSIIADRLTRRCSFEKQKARRGVQVLLKDFENDCRLSQELAAATALISLYTTATSGFFHLCSMVSAPKYLPCLNQPCQNSSKGERVQSRRSLRTSSRGRYPRR